MRPITAVGAVTIACTTFLLSYSRPSRDAALAHVSQIDSVAYVDSVTDVLEKNGYVIDALEMLNKVQNPTDELIRRKSRILSRMAQYEDVVKTLEPLVQRDSLPEDINLLANAHESLNSYLPAVMLRYAIHNKLPFNSTNLVLLTNLLEKMEDYEGGVKLLDSYLKKYPNHIPMKQQRARLNYGARNIDASYAEYNELYDMGDRSINTVYYSGKYYMVKGDPRKGAQRFEEAIQLSNETNVYAMIDFAKCQLGGGMQKTPPSYYLQIADSLLTRTPDELWLRQNISMLEAEQLSRRGDKKAAVKKFEEALAFDPSATDIIYQLAINYKALSKTKKEEYYWRKYIEGVGKLQSQSGKVHDRLEYANQRLQAIRQEQVETEFMKK